MRPVQPVYFKSAAEFRAWLEERHAQAAEALIGFYKAKSGQAGMTYQEALDQALCFGWIDGVRKSVDEARYTIRFTPRRPRSIWSQVNIRRVAELARLGLMREAGEKAFAARDVKCMNLYSNEQQHIEFSPAQEKEFRAQPAAWKFFSSQPPGYRKTATWWVVSAKKEETRQRRLEQLMRDSENGSRIKALTSPKAG